jgi:hypothetical protein
VSDDVKAKVHRKAQELVEKHLKPEYVKVPPNEPRWNYLTRHLLYEHWAVLQQMLLDGLAYQAGPRNSFSALS